MGRYVDVEYIKAVMLNDRLLQGNAEFTLYEQQVDLYVKALPSIDIVRCGECIHNGSYDTDCPFGWRKGEWNLPKPCDFCSYGEREVE